MEDSTMHQTRRFLQYLPLLILMLAPANVFAAWSGRAPAGPELRADNAQNPDLSFADAKGGNGGGNGNGGNGGGNGGNGGGNGGNGGNGGGGNKPPKPPAALSADVQPDTWNTNWEHSE